MDLKETYNHIAKEWHRDHQADDWWEEGTDVFISLLDPGGLVLDAGCGGGTKSKYLLGHGLQVIGIDFSSGLLEIAREEAPQALFFELDMRDVPGLEREFDGIFAQASLLHIPKQEVRKVLVGFVSRLKPRGLLYVAVKGKRDNGPDEEVKEENDYGYQYQRFFSYFSLDELKERFEALGLKIVYQDVKRTGKSEWVQLIGQK